MPSYYKDLQKTIEQVQNKNVSAKNAFEVDLSCISNIEEFVKS